MRQRPFADIIPFNRIDDLVTHHFNDLLKKSKRGSRTIVYNYLHHMRFFNRSIQITLEGRRRTLPNNLPAKEYSDQALYQSLSTVSLLNPGNLTPLILSRKIFNAPNNGRIPEFAKSEKTSSIILAEVPIHLPNRTSRDMR